jgi:hypothetical protein
MTLFLLMKNFNRAYRTKKRTINGSIVETLLILDCMRSTDMTLTGLVGALFFYDLQILKTTAT